MRILTSFRDWISSVSEDQKQVDHDAGKRPCRATSDRPLQERSNIPDRQRESMRPATPPDTILMRQDPFVRMIATSYS